MDSTHIQSSEAHVLEDTTVRIFHSYTPQTDGVTKEAWSWVLVQCLPHETVGKELNDTEHHAL